MHDQASHRSLASLEIRRRKRLHNRSTIHKPRSEDSVCVLEHAVFQTDDDELTALESGLDQSADILRVRQIQSSIYFVEDVHGCWLELKEGHDEGEGDEGSDNMLVLVW